MKNKEIELILTKLKIVSEEKENGAYICDREHSKLLLSYIEQLEEDNEYLKRLCETQNNREYRSKFLKEFQKERGKNVFPDYDEIYKRYDKLKEENKQLGNNRDKAIEIINIEKSEMGYAKFDSCLLLIEQTLKGDSDGNL